ncbi:hypothetical protein BC830DRAFT_1092401 [Chytriomyces sp. MP71]|nr:hypothetical protein BC830DRAFT_1092401 [Chytriomyces sp. MP71]
MLHSRGGSKHTSTENLRAPPISIPIHEIDGGESGLHEASALPGIGNASRNSSHHSSATNLNSENFNNQTVATNSTEKTTTVSTDYSQPLGSSLETCGHNINLPMEYTSITAHSFSYFGILRYALVSLLSCAVVPLLCVNITWLRTILIRTRCPHFSEADYVLVESSDGRFVEILVSRSEIILMHNSVLAALFDPFPARYSSLANLHTNNTHRVTMEMDGKREYVRLDKDVDENPTFSPNASLENNESRKDSFRYFEYRKQRYVYQPGSNCFMRVNLRLHTNFEHVHSLRHGLSETDAEALLQRNGENVIEVESISTLAMLNEKIFHPFYLFQVASVFIWTYEEYYLYSYIIAITSIASIVWEIHLAKANERSLRELLKEDVDVVVLRNNGSGTVSVATTIRAQHLVVGDAILMQPGTSAVADIVLVQGDAVVDESSLTGESVPVVKSALSFFGRTGQMFTADRCKGSMLFCGSRVLEVKPGANAVPESHDKGSELVIGIVTATGFNSSKGELFRGILYPNKIDFKFYKDALIFIGVLGLIAVIAFINRLIHGLKQGYGTVWAIITSLDIITIAVPPALPLVLTVGVSQAIARLKKKNIYCISPDRINYAGRIDVFCWDKTGTLTTSKLSWAGVDRARDNLFIGLRKVLRRDGDGDIERALAACHALNEVNGELVGSSVDVELFNSTKFHLSQDEPTVMWNGHIFPVLARVHKPLLHASTPQSTPVQPNIPEAHAIMESTGTPGSLSISIPNHNLLHELVASPTAATPTSLPITSGPESLIILKRFEFDAKLQRMSVVYKPSHSHRSPMTATPITPDTPTASKHILPWEALTVVTKGSPEVIRNICRQSTIPPDYNTVYTHYATAGWYVFGVAMKVLDGKPEEIPQAPKSNNVLGGKGLKKSSSMRGFLLSGRSDSPKTLFHTSASITMGPSPLSGRTASSSTMRDSTNSPVIIQTAEDLAILTRDRVERDMKFLGFVLLQNPLKSESIPTVTMLTEANVKSTIITGDNVMTAINVARQLQLCKQVLLIDVYDGVLGFRRLKNTVLNPSTNLTIPSFELTKASSIDSLASLTESPMMKRRKPPIKANTADSALLEHQESNNESTEDLYVKPTRVSISGTVPTPPKIRIRSATVQNQSLPQSTKESFKVYPLEEIGRTQSQMPAGSEVAVTGIALEMLIATKDGWMSKENMLGERFLDWLVLKGCVFARMKPDQKTWIIERMIKLGKYVGMCGDGTNDTGALKAAHVGLALSDAEASIVAPFTSTKKYVADVMQLVREGRCALDISFMAFKYMFMYPLVQLTMTATLNQFGSGLSNNQFLFDDLFVVLGLAFFMLRSGPSRVLAHHRPTDDLLSAPIIYSVLGQFVICTGMFALNFYTLSSEQNWFCSIATASQALNSIWLPVNASAPFDVSYPCYYINPQDDVVGSLLIKSEENTVVWLFAHFQFAILSLAFIFKSSHRKPLYTNLLYLLYLTLVLGVMVLFQLSWEQWQGFDIMQEVFSIREGVSWNQRIQSLCIAGLNLVLSLIWETVIIDRFVTKWVEERESKDQLKFEAKVAKQAGILTVNDKESMKKKRTLLQHFGMLTGIVAGKDPVLQQSGNPQQPQQAGFNIAWEGYVQSVVSAGANQRLDTRLDMASELRNARSWGDMDRDQEGRTVHSVDARIPSERNSAIADRFVVEDGREAAFEKGFDAWR